MKRQRINKEYMLKLGKFTSMCFTVNGSLHSTEDGGEITL